MHYCRLTVREQCQREVRLDRWGAFRLVAVSGQEHHLSQDALKLLSPGVKEADKGHKQEQGESLLKLYHNSPNACIFGLSVCQQSGQKQGEVLSHHLSSSVHWDGVPGQICPGLQTPHERVSHHGTKGGSCLQVTLTAQNHLTHLLLFHNSTCLLQTTWKIWEKASHTEWLTHTLPVLLWIFSSPHILGNWWKGLFWMLKRQGWNMLVQIWPTQWIHYIQQDPSLWLQQADYQAKV